MGLIDTVAIKKVNPIMEDDFEAIPKADYEARLKADMVAMLEELKTEIGKIAEEEKYHDAKWALGLNYSKKIIQQKIDKLRGNKNGNE